jgi:hypothetical protein
MFFAMCAIFETEPWRSSAGGALVFEVVMGGETGSVECKMVRWLDVELWTDGPVNCAEWSVFVCVIMCMSKLIVDSGAGRCRV